MLKTTDSRIQAFNQSRKAEIGKFRYTKLQLCSVNIFMFPNKLMERLKTPHHKRTSQDTNESEILILNDLQWILIKTSVFPNDDCGYLEMNWFRDYLLN